MFFQSTGQILAYRNTQTIFTIDTIYDNIVDIDGKTLENI